jgi:CRP-like cAMP-binding protein
MAADLLAGFALFDPLTDAQRAAVAATAQDVTYPAGAQLFAEGEEAVGCWLIRSGLVTLDTYVPSRGPVVLQTLGRGDVLGWSWLVPPHHWHFTATAAEPVSALRLDTRRLHDLAAADPALGYTLALGLFEVLLDRLQNTRARLLDLYGSPRERRLRSEPEEHRALPAAPNEVRAGRERRLRSEPEGHRALPAAPNEVRAGRERSEGRP